MACAWRIRHKLILGLGLVVAIIALLLGGTFKGLSSYMATTKTMESKLAELEAAYELKHAMQAMVVQPSQEKQKSKKKENDSNAEAGSQRDLWEKSPGNLVDEKNDLKIRIAIASKALKNYETKLTDTLNRRRDPEKGYLPRVIIDEIARGFDRLDLKIDDSFDEVTASLHQGEVITNDSGTKNPDKALRTPEINGIIAILVHQSDELLQAIDDTMKKRIEEAKVQYGQSMWIVCSTSVCGILLMIGLLRFFYGWVFHPIRDLEQGAGRVAQGDFEHRIEVHSGDEMEDLAAAFNNMTGRLREMYRDLAKQVNERSRQLVRSERLAGVGFLAAGVAHEINNPLASIAFCSEALEARLADLIQPKSKVLGPRLKLETGGGREQDWEVVIKYLKMIQDEAFRCKEITERLLEFSRTGERRREQTNLADLIQSVLDMAQHLQNRRGKEVVFEPAGPLTAWVNAQEIKSVVLNLVVNSLDSMEDGGTLTVNLRQQHEMAEMVFTDTGCGMTAEVLENIFEPFFTRSRTGKGTGLGLTITHRVITQHGGEIEAASPGVNKGSTFTVRLPLQPVENNEIPTPLDQQQAPLRKQAA